MALASSNFPLQVDPVFSHAVPNGHPVDPQQSRRLTLVAVRGLKGIDELLPFDAAVFSDGHVG